MKKTMPAPEELYKRIKRRMGIGDEVIQESIVYLDSNSIEERSHLGHVLLLNYDGHIKDYYTLAQIEWRLNLRDPSENMLNALKCACNIIVSAEKYQIPISSTSEFKHSELAANIAMILSGELPRWIEAFLEPEEEVLNKKSRITSDEIHKHIGSSLIYCIRDSVISECWKKIINELEVRKEGKLYFEANKAYEVLLESVIVQNEERIISSIETINKNFSKRIACDFDPSNGGGACHSIGIDYSAAAILKKCRIDNLPELTPHVWKFEEVDVGSVDKVLNL